MLQACQRFVVMWCFRNVGNQTTKHHVTPQIKPESQCCSLT